MRRHNEIYTLTNRERWTILAELHAKWGNDGLAEYFRELAETGDE